MANKFKKPWGNCPINNEWGKSLRSLQTECVSGRLHYTDGTIDRVDIAHSEELGTYLSFPPEAVARFVAAAANREIARPT